jgi:hypothetical protein
MQNRSPPAARGPSSNTWPRCESHRPQRTSVRTMPCETSRTSDTESSPIAEVKLGHPLRQRASASRRTCAECTSDAVSKGRRDGESIGPCRGRPGQPSGSPSFKGGLVTKTTTTSSRSTARPATRPTCSCPGCASSSGRSTRSGSTRGCRYPAGEIGVVIAQVGEALADRREVRRLQRGVRQLQPTSQLHGQRRPEGRAAPGAAPGHHRCRSTPSAFMVLTSRRGVRHAGLARAGALARHAPPHAAVRARARASCGHRDRAAGRPRRGRHRHHARGPAPLEKATSPVASAATSDITADGGSPDGCSDAEIIETAARAKNDLHNNYQDFQKFLDHGGRIGLQHDPLLYGAYLLNPFLVRVELVPMLVVQPGSRSPSSRLRRPAHRSTPRARSSSSAPSSSPGHRGIWQEPLRTGKYPINPRMLRRRDRADVDPHAQLGATPPAQAHNLDATSRPSRARAARASCSPSTCRCRSTCPTPGAEGHLDGRHHA